MFSNVSIYFSLPIKPADASLMTSLVQIYQTFFLCVNRKSHSSNRTRVRIVEKQRDNTTSINTC